LYFSTDGCINKSLTYLLTYCLQTPASRARFLIIFIHHNLVGSNLKDEINKRTHKGTKSTLRTKTSYLCARISHRRLSDVPYFVWNSIV